MSMGDGITWALAAVIFLAFCAGLKRLYRHFVSGESSCCGTGCSAGCAGCTKERSLRRSGSRPPRRGRPSGQRRGSIAGTALTGRTDNIRQHLSGGAVFVFLF